MYKLLILSLMLTACGTDIANMNNDKQNKRETDYKTIEGIGDDFADYYKAFEKDCELTIGDIPIQFGKLDGEAVGTCFYWDNGDREIKIDKEFWNSETTDNSMRQWLIYHELGHCRLNLEHVDTLDDSGKPESIMLPYVPWESEQLLKDNKAYYIKQLCKG